MDDVISPDTARADAFWMARALKLAQRGKYTTSPNPQVGCVIVDSSGTCVGQGAHLKAGTPHAEVHALAEAGENARGATAYVTLEPCSHTGRTPPCADALIKAGVSRVVAAMTDPNPQVSGRGLNRLRDAGIAVRSDVLAGEARQLNRGFIKRMQTGRPFVTLKLAISLDGKVALRNGQSQWITGPEARRDVQRFRAQSCAILTGAGTVREDNPSLLVRPSQAELADYPADEIRQPLRVVLNRRGDLDGSATVFNDGFPTLLAVSEQAETQYNNVLRLPENADGLDLVALMQSLGERQINNLWVEGGATLAGSLIQCELADELMVYQAPVLMGDKARGMLSLGEITRMQDVINLTCQSRTQVGKDSRLIFSINPAPE